MGYVELRWVPAWKITVGVAAACVDATTRKVVKNSGTRRMDRVHILFDSFLNFGWFFTSSLLPITETQARGKIW